MHGETCYGTCFAVVDIDKKYTDTKIILTARHCVYSEVTSTIPINDGLFFTSGNDSFGSPDVTHVATAKNLDLSAFRVKDPDNFISTSKIGSSISIYPSFRIFLGGYPDVTNQMHLHMEQPKYYFSSVSSYRNDDYRVTCTINSCLPNHSGSPVIAYSDTRGEYIIGMHIETLSYSDDKNKVDSSVVSEDFGGIVAILEEVDLEAKSKKKNLKSPNFDRTQQRAKYSEDNVPYKTSMGVFVQCSALSVFYHTALDIRMRNPIITTSSGAKRRRES